MDHHQQMSTNWTCNRSVWSWEENKAFENALAINLGDIYPWEKIAAAVPGQTVEEIKDHFMALYEDINAIESGLVPLPLYADSSTKKSKTHAGHATRGRRKNQSGKKSVESSKREGSSQSNGRRRRGVSWSLEEHRLFLEGLKKYGKGDWRSISRHCVLSRTSTQVASHAQKYFKRNAVNATKKRSSIHDMKIMDDDLVNPKGQTIEVKDSGQPVASLGSCSKCDNVYMGCDKNSRFDNASDDVEKYPHVESARFEGHEHPILESSGIHLCSYPNAGQLEMSTLRGPWTKSEVGSSCVGLASNSICSQLGMFTPQQPIIHQTNGATDVGFITDQNPIHHRIPTLQGARSLPIVGPPVRNNLDSMPNLQVPVTQEMIIPPSFGFNGLASSSKDHMFPQGGIAAQTSRKDVRGCSYFGEWPSFLRSGFNSYSHQIARQPVLASVFSATDVPNCYASPVPMTNYSGAASNIFTPGHSVDLQNPGFPSPHYQLGYDAF